MRKVTDIGSVGREWAGYSAYKHTTSELMAHVCCSVLDLLDILGIYSAGLDIEDSIDFDHAQHYAERLISHTPHLDTHVQSLQRQRLR